MEVKRTFDLLERYKQVHGEKPDVLAARLNTGWEKFSLSDYTDMANNFSYGLLELGFKKGDKIATVSNNRPQWNFVDIGSAQVGVVHVPIYPTISSADYTHILAHSEAKILIVSNAILYVKLLPIVSKIESLDNIYTFDDIEGTLNWMEIVELGKKHAEKWKAKLEEIKASIVPDDLLSIIYTSGTTGVPKGVMLTHNNFMSNVRDTHHLLPVGAKERALSFLPLCHVLERMVNYLYHYNGVSIYYAENTESLVRDLNEINPEIFVAVPRVIEKVYDKLVAKGKMLTGVKRQLYHWAIDLALDFELNHANGWLYDKKLAIADKLIYSKWREALGNNVKYVIVGGAALQPRLSRTFWAAQIKVLEGYGLTETSPVIAVNQTEYPNIKFGTVGPVIDNVQVRIAEDGEILVKGPNVMKGYYKWPEKTEEVMTDGWLHTGDIGVLHENNILQITDRKKEMFKLSGGKYIAPQVIENKLKESFFIEQVMVVGDGEKFAAALISPNFEFLHDWCAKEKVHYRDNIDLIEDKRVLERYQEEIEKINKMLGKTETIKKFLLVCEDWTPDNGALSPTLKVKRRILKQKYKVKLDRLYGYTDELGHVLRRNEDGQLISAETKK